MDDAEAALAAAPDEAAARRYLAAAREAGRRDAAVAFLRGLYERTRHPGLWAAITGGFTAPELDGLAAPDAPPPPTSDGEPRLKPRPYRDVYLGALAAPVSSPGAVFLLVISGILMLGSVVAIRLLGCMGLAMASFLYGYLFANLFDVLLQAADGRARPPKIIGLIWYEGGRFEFVAQFLRWLGAALATFGPIVVVILAAGRAMPPWGWTLLAVVGFAAGAWHPIALLQAACGNGFSAFNYPAAFDRLRRLGADYARCAGLFLATNAAVVVVQIAGAAWSGDHEYRQLAARVVAGTATFAAWQIQMRAAGLLAWSRADVR